MLFVVDFNDALFKGIVVLPDSVGQFSSSSDCSKENANVCATELLM